MSRDPMKRRALTQTRLKVLLRYNRSTGAFLWLQARGRVTLGSPAGSIARDGRVYIRIDGIRYAAHQLAWLYVTGEWAEPEVDHRDCDSSNNSFKNLRPATRRQNQQNHRVRRDSATGFKGVRYVARNRKNPFLAYIVIDGQRKHLGCYRTSTEASAAYQFAAKAAFGQFARAS